MRHEMNRTKSKYLHIGLYKILIFFLFSYYDKIYILNDDCSRLSHFHEFTR